MKVRFLADADLNKAIISGVVRREPSIDFLTAQAAALRKMKDPEVLALAAAQQRVLVSHDVGTMPGLSCIQGFRKAQRWPVPCRAIPRYRNCNRRTPAHLARFGSVRLGEPARMAAPMKLGRTPAGSPR